MEDDYQADASLTDERAATDGVEVTAKTVIVLLVCVLISATGLRLLRWNIKD